MWRTKLAIYLRERENFIKAAWTFFSVGSAIVLLLMFGKYGGIGLWAMIVAASYFAGWIWARLMWLFVAKK